MKILTIIGTRPQFIKMPLLSDKLKENNIDEIILHTGQHFDVNMSDNFFKELNIPYPKYNININSNNYNNQSSLLGIMIDKISDIILLEIPNYIMVYGDCDTTLAGALSANKLNYPIIHIESGLRSYDKTMPEEINRILVDHISTILFCPTQNSVDNLKKENINKNIYLVGDLMIELLRKNKDIYLSNDNNFLKEYNLNKKEYYLLTLHRKSNTTLERFKNIINNLSKLNKKILYPIHPRINYIIKQINLPNNFIICEPFSYKKMMNLLYNSYQLITDSGGLQKEAYELEIPCITIRENTEWIETVYNDKNILINDNFDIIEKFNPDNIYKNIFIDNSSKNIVNIIKNIL